MTQALSILANYIPNVLTNNVTHSCLDTAVRDHVLAKQLIVLGLDGGTGLS